MKGFSTESFAKAIRAGLRPFAENTRDEVGLLECHNLAPAEKGLRLHSVISSINAGSWGDTSAIPTVTFTSWEDIT